MGRSPHGHGPAGWLDLPGQPATARPGLDPRDAAAALGLPPEALEDGREPLPAEELAAAGLVRLHAEAAGRAEPPASAARLVALAAEGDPPAGPLARAILADRLAAAAVLARAGASGSPDLPLQAAVRGQVMTAVARLGRAEAARVAAAWAVKPLASRGSGEAPEALAPLWPELFRRAAVTARLGGALASAARLEAGGQAYAAGLVGALGGAAALRSFAALVRDGTLVPRPGPWALRVVRQAQVALEPEHWRAWGVGLAAEPGWSAGAGEGRWQPVAPLLQLAAALDDLASGPGIDARAAWRAAAAAGRLGLSPAALAAATVRQRDAAAWVRAWILPG